MIVYKIWDRQNGSYINRFNKPNDVDWYNLKETAEHYIPVLCKAWKCDADNFEIHRFAISQRRLKD